MRRYLRILFQDQEDGWDSLYLDLLVDCEGQVCPDIPFCGWWGNLKSTDVYTFIVKPKAEGGYVIDFGSDEETDQTTRLVDFLLPHSAIQIGSEIAFTYENEPVKLKAFKLTDMILGELIT